MRFRSDRRQVLRREELRVHAHDQHFLVMAAVEDADLAALGQARGDALQEIVPEFELARPAEGVHAKACRVHAREHLADRAVLARRRPSPGTPSSSAWRSSANSRCWSSSSRSTSSFSSASSFASSSGWPSAGPCRNRRSGTCRRRARDGASDNRSSSASSLGRPSAERTARALRQSPRRSNRSRSSAASRARSIMSPTSGASRPGRLPPEVEHAGRAHRVRAGRIGRRRPEGAVGEQHESEAEREQRDRDVGIGREGARQHEARDQQQSGHRRDAAAPRGSEATAQAVADRPRRRPPAPLRSERQHVHPAAFQAARNRAIRRQVDVRATTRT